MTWMQALGLALNLAGLAITAVGIAWQARQREADLIGQRVRIAVAWVRRRVPGLKPRNVTLAAGTARVTSIALPTTVTALRGRQVSDPLQDQIDALEHNLNAHVAALGERIGQEHTHTTEQVGKLRVELRSLATRVHEASQQELTTAEGALRWELGGVALALLGTTLAALG